MQSEISEQIFAAMGAVAILITVNFHSITAAIANPVEALRRE